MLQGPEVQPHVTFFNSKVNQVMDQMPLTMPVIVLMASTGFSSTDSELIDEPTLLGMLFLMCEVNFFLNDFCVPSRFYKTSSLMGKRSSLTLGMTVRYSNISKVGTEDIVSTELVNVEAISLEVRQQDGDWLQP